MLIAGGESERRYFTSTELYDPRTGDFTLSSSLGGSRSFHTAASTEDNRVLLVGGGGPRFITRGAQLYYTSIGDITRTSDMIHARIRPTATRLLDSRILVVGGWGSYNYLTPIASAELYDAAEESFTLAGYLDSERALHTATILRDGRLLLVGGRDSRLPSLLPSYTTPQLGSSPLKVP